MKIYLTAALFLGILVLGSTAGAQPPDETKTRHQRFLQQQGLALRDGDAAPATPEEWKAARDHLRSQLRRAWGGFPETPCPLEPQLLGYVDFDGYRVERLIFQTLPDVWMTANAYVPSAASDGSSGRLPAVLCVHGHWSGAKQDPVVQSRCIGLARLGFFVLVVDAFGAGERAIGKALGEYHGEMTGAMLLPIGKPLAGIQVYENMRAVDYLQTRPEVDPQRIGITGASGGGNQSMYAGGMDDRFRCVVPTCSVGTYQSYLHAACCMCEVVPGGLRLAEEGNILGLSAGRGLMVTSATRDAYQFSVDLARISVARAQSIEKLLGDGEVRHTIIESPHHYNQPMREAMYGWMTLHLKGEGSGAPISEPALEPVDPELIRCFPGASRPGGFVTIPRFAHREGTRLLEERRSADQQRCERLASAAPEEREQDRLSEVSRLVDLLGGATLRVPPPDQRAAKLSDVRTSPDDRFEIAELESEPGLDIQIWRDRPGASADTSSNVQPQRIAILANADASAEETIRGRLAGQLREAGYRVVVPELRGTGGAAHPSDRISHAPDHNSAEWSMWIGRPLAGQWAWDIQRTVDLSVSGGGSANGDTVPSDVTVVGVGSAGLAAMIASAVDQRIGRIAAVESLVSWVSDVPYRGHRMAVMIPGVLPTVGDVQHLAALSAPRRVIIAGGRLGGGQEVTEDELKTRYSVAARVFAAYGCPEQMMVTGAEGLLEALQR